MKRRQPIVTDTSMRQKLGTSSLVMKRCFDMAVAGAALAFASPALLATAVIVRLGLGSPVLFRQTRPGLREAPFEMMKFRTMRDAFDAQGNALPDADRLTRLGQFLRSTSLDELPALWSVFKGEMSIVGPRPLLPQYLSRYSELQRRRHEVKPGITGWAQVNGRNSLSWDEKFRLDLWYVDHRSLALDFKILFRTLLIVLQRDGITQNGHATMPEFLGNAGSGTPLSTESAR
jgi:lipopolysaccharide/colanic/teichoic acid biosynthesis glycosyltransferase